MLGEQLRRLREQRDLFQKEVAEAVGISHVQLSRYESEVRAPDHATLVKLAEFYGVTTDYLLGHVQPTGGKEDDDEWRELLRQARAKGTELEATALLRTSGKLTKAQLRDLIRVFDMIDSDQQEK